MVQEEGKNREAEKFLKELKHIKNLLIISLLKTGTTSEEVNYATGMGAANIRRMFPMKLGRSKAKTSSRSENSPAVS